VKEGSVWAAGQQAEGTSARGSDGDWPGAFNSCKGIPSLWIRPSWQRHCAGAHLRVPTRA